MAQLHIDTPRNLHVGDTVRIQSFGRMYDATVTELTARRAHVTYTNQSGNTYDFWLTRPGFGKKDLDPRGAALSKARSALTRTIKRLARAEQQKEESQAKGYSTNYDTWIGQLKEEIVELEAEIKRLSRVEA
jgi:hypothetical protein